MVAVLPAGAVGAQSRAHGNPGSPAGYQYVIPVVGARNLGAGTPGSSAGANPPAFGVGITPTTTGARSNAGHTRRAAVHAKRRNRGTRAVAGAGVTPPGQPPAAHDPPAGGRAGGNGWMALALGGALVLVVGGAGGLALRRLSS